VLQDELQKWRRRTIHRHYHCIPQAISVFVLFCLVFVLLCFVYVHSRNHEPFIEPKRLHTFEQARRSGIPITEDGRCGILRFVTHRRASLPMRVLRRGEKWSTDGRTDFRQGFGKKGGRLASAGMYHYRAGDSSDDALSVGGASPLVVSS